jgi:serine/threonine protein kinase
MQLLMFHHHPTAVSTSSVLAPDTKSSCSTEKESLIFNPGGPWFIALFVAPCVQVSLVLEYCDWGSVRTALDAGAFFAQDNSLNYAAILDTAADVAKAMLHLHKNHVSGSAPVL